MFKIKTLSLPFFISFLILILHNISGTASESMQNTKLNVTTVNTSEELHQALITVEKGHTILLAEGIYIGQFETHQDSITLKGQKNSTIQLDTNYTGTLDRHIVALNILGDNCSIIDINIITPVTSYTTGIEINSQKNTVSGVSLDGFEIGINPMNSDNTFSNLSIKNGYRGFDISANRTSLVNIKLQNITLLGAAWICGDNNTISNLTCLNCRYGIFIEGNGNHMKNIELSSLYNTTLPSYEWGIYIYSGSRNIVDKFKGKGFKLEFGFGSKAKIRDSTFGRVYIWGTNHTLVNIDAGELLWISRSSGGHRIVNTKAKKLENDSKDVDMTQCNFGTEVGLGTERGWVWTWANGAVILFLGAFSIFVCYLVVRMIYRAWALGRLKTIVFSK